MAPRLCTSYLAMKKMYNLYRYIPYFPTYKPMGLYVKICCKKEFLLCEYARVEAHTLICAIKVCLCSKQRCYHNA